MGLRIKAVNDFNVSCNSAKEKNIQPLNDKPLIAWTIEQAKRSRYIDRLIVSTDDMEIAEIARQYNAEVPFLRPKTLAGDKTTTMSVILHLLDWLKKNKTPFDILVLLQPTSPFRLAEDIDKAIDVFFNKNAKSVVSVCETENIHAWSNILPENGCMKRFIRMVIGERNRQSLSRYYQLNGAIYVAYTKYLMKKKNFFGIATYAYVMPALRSVDIDEQIDLDWAEFLVAKHMLDRRHV